MKEEQQEKIKSAEAIQISIDGSSLSPSELEVVLEDKEDIAVRLAPRAKERVAEARRALEDIMEKVLTKEKFNENCEK